MDKRDFLARNEKTAREFKGLDLQRSEEIGARVAAYWDNKEVEIYRKWG